jgi:hypothetical protein
MICCAGFSWRSLNLDGDVFPVIDFVGELPTFYQFIFIFIFTLFIFASTLN